MKKFIPLLLLLSSLSYAESMQFVTVLSSPVGTFNKLEAVDTENPAKGTTVNFCTALGTGGTVALRGTNTAQLSKVELSNGTTLGRTTDTGKYSLDKITLQTGGTLKGGQLLGDQLTVTQEAAGEAKNVYGTSLTVAGAKTVGLNVGSGKSVMDGMGSAGQMVWSNKYQDDSACKSTGCAKQYLLKEELSSCNAADVSACSAAGGTMNTTTCNCVCPASKQPTQGQTYTERCPKDQTGSVVYTWNASKCAYSKKSNCTPSQQITCITSSQWKSTYSTPSADQPLKCGTPQWLPGAWTTGMTCGTETVHYSGYVKWEQLENCEPGKYYLYYETYECSADSGGYCPIVGHGWWCLKCGTVSNASQCVQKSSITKMSGSCLNSGSGSGNEEFKTTDEGLPYIP